MKNTTTAPMQATAVPVVTTGCLTLTGAQPRCSATRLQARAKKRGLFPVLLELRRERVGSPREHHEVAAHGDEEVTHVDAAFAVRLADEDARRFACCADPLRRFLHDFPDFRVLPVAEVAHVSGKIVRSDEDAVDAVDAGDRLEVRERRARLDLEQQADFVMDAPEVILDASV